MKPPSELGFVPTAETPASANFSKAKPECLVSKKMTILPFTEAGLKRKKLLII
jgi:hypothetical protein